MVPLLDLRRRTAPITAELMQAIGRVVERGQYCLGPEVSAFEREFATYCGRAYCVTVNSGTDALELALRSLGVGVGHRVVTVANAGGYTSAAITAIGALPVYVDVDPVSLNMSGQDLRCVLDPEIKAVVVTHLYGRLAEIEALSEIAGTHGVPVIEDCAQAHGAERAGRRAGGFGAAGCFSFYPTKNLGALGDGGAIVTDDAELNQRLLELRQYGWRGKYVAAVAGGRNSRMDEVQAAVLRILLPRLSDWNCRRRLVADVLSASLRSLPGVVVPEVGGTEHVVHLYVVRVQRREYLQTRLAELGVATAVHYPVADYCQPRYADLFGCSRTLANTEAACREVLTLPCFPEMQEAEVTHVIEALVEAIR